MFEVELVSFIDQSASDEFAEFSLVGLLWGNKSNISVQ